MCHDRNGRRNTSIAPLDEFERVMVDMNLVTTGGVHIEAEDECVGILDVVPGFVTTQIVATASNAMSVRIEVVALRETFTTVHDQSIPEARHHIVVD